MKRVVVTTEYTFGNDQEYEYYLQYLANFGEPVLESVVDQIRRTGQGAFESVLGTWQARTSYQVQEVH
jgi:hypothetical protein